MDNKQILETAIQKAIDGGWNNTWDKDTVASFMIDYKPERYIYSHEFAKAIWGSEYVPNGYGALNSTKNNAVLIPAYHFHLQRMVIAEDPIAYLGDNI